MLEAGQTRPLLPVVQMCHSQTSIFLLCFRALLITLRNSFSRISRSLKTSDYTTMQPKAKLNTTYMVVLWLVGWLVDFTSFIVQFLPVSSFFGKVCLLDLPPGAIDFFSSVKCDKCPCGKYQAIVSSLD